MGHPRGTVAVHVPGRLRPLHTSGEGLVRLVSQPLLRAELRDPRRTRVVALSTIEKGEEVTIDYSTNVGWDGFAMECHCGCPGADKIIRSYRYLDPHLRGSYGACVSRFLLERSS